MKKISTFLFAAAVMIMAMFSSCVSQKKIIYLQGNNTDTMNDSIFMSMEYENERTFDYKVQPGDNLYIRIASLDERSSAFFNSMNQAGNLASGGGNSSGNASIYLNGYTVGADGYIDLIMIGKVFVKDPVLSSPLSPSLRRPSYMMNIKTSVIFKCHL